MARISVPEIVYANGRAVTFEHSLLPFDLDLLRKPCCLASLYPRASQGDSAAFPVCSWEKRARRLLLLHGFEKCYRRLTQRDMFSLLLFCVVAVTRPGKLSRRRLEISACVVRFVPVWRARLQLM